MDEHQVRSLLPHGEGFIFVERLEDLFAGQQGTGIKVFRKDEPILRAHFPGRPLVPGSILLEMVAQTAGLVAGAQEEEAEKEHEGHHRFLLAGIERVRFRRPVLPDRPVKASVKLLHKRGPVLWFSFSITVEGQAAVSGEVILRRDDGRLKT